MIYVQLIAGLTLLIIGGEFLVRGASQLAGRLGISPVVIGLTVVAFGTSAPELAVSMNAALSGNADIAVANVVGSNIFNILFILGLSGLISPLIIHSQMIKREVPIMILASVVFYALSLSGTISRVNGVCLFIGIVVYTVWLVRSARKETKQHSEISVELEAEYGPKVLPKHSYLHSLFFISAGLLIIMAGADWLVKGAVFVASVLGVNDTIIGLTIVAAGTSLPEVAASVIATIKGEKDIAVGNVIGSNIYNILAIIGASSALVPNGLMVDSSMLYFDFPVMLAVAVLCFPFFLSGVLTRGKGALFLLGYIVYTGLLIQRAS